MAETIVRFIEGVLVGLGVIGWIKTIFLQNTINVLLDAVMRQNNILDGLIRYNKEDIFLKDDILKNISKLKEAIDRLTK